MVYRKGELTPGAIDRGWPHQVALREAACTGANHGIHLDFCKDLSLCFADNSAASRSIPKIAAAAPPGRSGAARRASRNGGDGGRDQCGSPWLPSWSSASGRAILPSSAAAVAAWEISSIALLIKSPATSPSSLSSDSRTQISA
jgi:hypothetical protein